MRSDSTHIALGLLLLVALALPAQIHAHALSPSLLIVREGAAAGQAEVLWKTPLVRIPGTEVRPLLPDDCTPTSPARMDADFESVTATWSVECAGGSLIGKKFGVEGLAAAKTDALLRLELRDGSEIDTVLRSSRPSFTVPAHPEPLDVARRFATLGFDHIASGYDHLLFVLGLLLLVQGTRALIATISAFTLGHSITLTLAVLGVTNVPSAAVEVLIAFSVFILATELARGRVARSRGARWLCAMAALFGLLHGLGFAGMLREVGLPSGAIPLALACFNLGIEAGQLAFVVAIILIGAAMRALTLAPPAWSRMLVVYAMGSVAALWMIQRTLPLL